ncbi:MAG: hypothetical protein J6W81_08160 [Lentisphaeria bacterium]|nr:hypothetical protein [Lentisphaeria bacterium]
MEDQFCFVDSFTYSLDTQRRIAIPSCWRKKDGETVFYLLPAKENIVQLIPKETFYEQVIRKAQKMSLADARQLRDLALCASRAQSCVCDKQGRIQISQKLLDHGGFKDKIVLAGAFWHIQLWTPERWDALNSGENSDFFDVMQRINEMPDPQGGR